VLATLSLASDMGLGHQLETGLRTCLVSLLLAERLGVAAQTAADVFHIALLSHAGCTAESRRVADVVGDEIAFSDAATPLAAGNQSEMVRLLLRLAVADQGPLRRVATVAQTLPWLKSTFTASAEAHCEVAQLLSDRLGMPPAVRHGLGFVGERWDGKGMVQGAGGEDIPLCVRVFQVAQEVGIFGAAGGADAARAVLHARAGGALDPAIVDVALPAVDDLVEPALEPESVWTTILDAEAGEPAVLVDGEVDEALSTIGDFADLKSFFTTGHSNGVATLAAAAAEVCGMRDVDVRAVRRAGYVHDVGRAAIPVLVWERDGALGADDREKVRLHPYHTQRLLDRSAALSPLGAIASLHHERLDGSGYHRSSPASQQPPPARILAAADVFHALTEPRPHRRGMPSEQAAALLREESTAGRLDPQAAAAVIAAAGERAGRVAWPKGLTEREVGVVRLLARGLATKQIARELSISPKTADRHIQNLYAKIGVSTRAGATVFAMHSGLLGWGELPMSLE
jgi:HD-GYP domain-containing protein (c-di-GMP phosphodiesterase class II)